MKCWVAQYSWSTYELNAHADEYHNKLSVDKNLLHFSFPLTYLQVLGCSNFIQKIAILLLNNNEWINSVHDSNSSWDQDGTQINFILFMAISSAVSLNNISMAFPKQWNKVLPFEFVTKNNNINFKVSYLFLFFNHRITINSGSSELRGTL